MISISPILNDSYLDFNKKGDWDQWDPIRTANLGDQIAESGSCPLRDSKGPRADWTEPVLHQPP